MYHLLLLLHSRRCFFAQWNIGKMTISYRTLRHFRISKIPPSSKKETIWWVYYRKCRRNWKETREDWTIEIYQFKAFCLFVAMAWFELMATTIIKSWAKLLGEAENEIMENDTTDETEESIFLLLQWIPGCEDVESSMRERSVSNNGWSNFHSCE